MARAQNSAKIWDLTVSPALRLGRVIQTSKLFELILTLNVLLLSLLLFFPLIISVTFAEKTVLQ